MANNYAQFSEAIVVPENKVQVVIEFLEAYETMCFNDEVDWYGGIDYTFPLKEGEKTLFWFHSDETYTNEELLYLVQGVLDAIESDEPVTVSVAYTCSKPCIGEFSGGCYAIWKDKDYYVDPYSAVVDYIKFHDGKPE